MLCFMCKIERRKEVWDLSSGVESTVNTKSREETSKPFRAGSNFTHKLGRTYGKTRLGYVYYSGKEHPTGCKQQDHRLIG